MFVICVSYVHKSCEELPKQINHHFHPHHPLFLQPHCITYCNSCGQRPEKYIMFGCRECDFYMDVECTQMSSNSIITTYSNEGQHCIQHSSHPHLLQLVNPSYADDMNVSCFACYESSDDDIEVYYYGCIRCKYFLHKQCIYQLPQQIQFSHHPNNHTHLSLHMKWQFEKIHTTHDRCNVHDNCLKQLVMKSNSKEFSKTDSSIFGCLECDFKLHLLCGPLPSVIKHESHMHCLNLVDSCIEDTFGDYYCDICEEERDPRLRVYYCGHCKYVAHVHCVISENLVVETYSSDHHLN
ncbi:hypothetical protein F8388_020845 [Cannabis sativa]|uniref:DC1 domain-containing protein n=1 Tax=Cannabis sativa TaxID=3483 RepID=A0A7J6FKF4_CANSA|nr:hypothetical protein F8388_020845 [Cannabis sativa]